MRISKNKRKETELTILHFTKYGLLTYTDEHYLPPAAAMTQELLTSHIYRGFFFVTRSASFRFWKLFSKIGNSLNKLNYLAVASFFLDPAWQKFGKKWRILEVFQKPETRVIRIHHCQQLIAILFWITYPRVRYPKKNDMTCPLLFPSRL